MTLTFPADFALLNEYLSTRSFVEYAGKPSENDKKILKDLKGVSFDAEKFPHVARWARCVAFHIEREMISASNSEIANLICKTAQSSLSSSAPEDDVDLFGSDDENDAEAEALKAKRVQEYQAKKAAKPAIIAKSLVVLDVKPLEDTTDLVEMEKRIREYSFDGLVWGTSKVIPIGFGISKLQISCAVEDAKVSVDMIEEFIMELEDYVQSVDVVSFNKL